MEKIVCLTSNSSSNMIEYKELDKLLEDGWEIVKMKPVSTNEMACCYVWLEKYDDDFDFDDDFDLDFDDSDDNLF